MSIKFLIRTCRLLLNFFPLLALMVFHITTYYSLCLLLLCKASWESVHLWLLLNNRNYLIAVPPLLSDLSELTPLHTDAF